ncbi:unnamed protein product [Penicillium glandicola]
MGRATSDIKTIVMASASFSGINSGLQVGGNSGNITANLNFTPETEIRFFNTCSYSEYKDINPARVKGTCEWFLGHQTFQKWRSSEDNDLLWLSADPGCGKSVLSKALIDEKLVDDGSATICYFFFKDNEEQNSIATAICALLHQLFYGRHDVFQKHAENLVRQHGERLKVDSGTLWQLWLSATSDPSVGDVICILDALDECGQADRDRLIQHLEQFYTTPRKEPHVGPKLKFLVTSRPYGNIERGFSQLTNRYPTIRLAADDESQAISEEINVVMQARVDEIAEKRHLSDEIRTALKHRFSEIPNRTYLWLHLTLDVIEGSLGLTKTKLFQRIDELPTTVEQAYEEILQRCDRDNLRDGRRLLELIVAAKRPLTVAEIDIALDIQPGARRFGDLDLEGVDKRKQWIREACGLFVSINGGHVHLIHQTAKEFLVQQGENAAVGSWKHSISLKNANLAISKICITYLRLKEFQNLELYNYLGRFRPEDQLLDYSADHWTYHVQEAASLEEDWLMKVEELCQAVNDPNFPWMKFHDKAGDYEMPTKLTSLYWPARLGLLQVMQLLLGRGGPDAKITNEVVVAAASNEERGEAVMRFLLDLRGGQGRRKIKHMFGHGVPDVKITNEVVVAAAANCQSGEAVMKLLLDQGGNQGRSKVRLLLSRQGADVKITDEVVQAAAANEESGEAIMKLLLDQRADIKVTDKVLEAAAGNGEAVMRLLLDQGGDVKITDEVVVAAAENWQSGPAMMNLLLDRRGADVKITDEVVKAAAANVGSGPAVMKLLLDRRGADVKITDEVVKAAIVNMVSGPAVIELLLDRRGADIKITDEVVKAAIVNVGSGPAMIELLLDRRGADVKITDEVVKAAAANLRSGPAVMNLLLDRRGADVKITDEVVVAAAENWQSGPAMMNLLLDRRGADVKITDEVVVAAAENWQSGPAVMNLLLDRRGADVKITDEVVVAAAENWQSGPAIMNLLLDRRGADVKITDEVVMAAIANLRCGPAMMNLLLDRRGADVKITDEVVVAAVENWQSGPAVINLLLNRRGADVKITDKVVKAATTNENSGAAVMKLLLDRRGADVNITDNVLEAAVDTWPTGEAR